MVFSMKKPRPAGDQTRQQILKAAKALFAKQGFAASSISQIAKRAGINQSLIYHHFKDKKSLWQLVKETHLQGYLQELDTLLQDTQLSGADWVRKILRTRLDTFSKKPDIQKMLYWQAIESNASLRYSPHYNFEQWIATVQRLQARHQLRADLTPDAILALISTSANGLMIYIDIKRPSASQIASYRALVEDACIAAVTPNNPSARSHS